MADPTRYTPGFNYSGWEADHPTEPKPGAELDNDFALIRHSIDETIRALKDVRRSDGKVQNGIVGFDALNPAVKAAIAGSEFDYEVLEEFAVKAANLQDLPDKGEARDNLDVPQRSANLNDLPDKAEARDNLDVPQRSANLADLPDVSEARASLGTFSTIADVEANDIPAVLGSIRTFGRNSPGDGPPLNLVRGSNVPGAIQSADGQWWEDVGYNSITVKIPSDFPTLQAAVDHYSRLPLRAGRIIELRIESDHALTHGLEVINGDYGHFRISSEDEVVYLAPGFTGPSAAGYGGINSDSANHLIMGYNARMPVLACLIDMENQGGSGYYGVWGCIGVVEPHCGVINAGDMGLAMRCGQCTAYQTNWSGANTHGIRAAYTSQIAAQSADASNCQKNPENPVGGAVDCSRSSVVHFRLGNASNSGGSGINCRRNSIVCFEEANLDNAAHNGALFIGASMGSGYGCSIVGTRSASSSSGLGRGLRVLQNSRVTVHGATIKNSAITDIVVESGGSVNASSVETTNGSPALEDTNLTAYGFGVQSIRGYISVQENHDEAPDVRWGKFSTTGQTRGKTIDEFSILRSSREETASAGHITFYNPNGNVGNITTSGEQVNYNTSSDARKKQDIEAIDEADDLFAKVQARKFRWKADGSRSYGFIAQEVLEQIPDACELGIVSRCEIDPENGPMMMDYSKLMPILWAEVAELRKQLQDLKDA